MIISSGMPTVNKSVLHTNISLQVSSGSIISNLLTVPFLPAVFVHTKEVNLSDVRMSTDITVSGRPDVLKHLKVSRGTCDYGFAVSLTVHLVAGITTKLKLDSLQGFYYIVIATFFKFGLFPSML